MDILVHEAYCIIQFQNPDCFEMKGIANDVIKVASVFQDTWRIDLWGRYGWINKCTDEWMLHARMNGCMHDCMGGLLRLLKISRGNENCCTLR